MLGSSFVFSPVALSRTVLVAFFSVFAIPFASDASAQVTADTSLESDSAAVTVRIDTIDGQSIVGRLRGLSDQGAVIVVDGDEASPRMLPLDQIMVAQRLNPPASTPTVSRVGLAGGSRVAIESITADGTTATLAVRGGKPMAVPLKRLRWVRFRAPSAAVDPQWLGLVETPRTSDTLVVRRQGDSIDEVAGVVMAIGAEAVTFNLDGDEMRAPIARLEGLLLATPAGEEAAGDGAVTVDDVSGSRWVATEILPGGDADKRGDTVRLRLGDGAEYRLPLAAISKIELSGSVDFLATGEPVEMRYVPMVSIGLSPELAGQWLGPQRLGNRDLVMRADSHVEYRLDEGFQSLVGSVDFDPAVTAGGQCVVRISLDGKPVWEETFDVSAVSPRGFELPVGGARRVRFEVVAGGDGDLGDTVRFRQPRVTK